MMAEPSTEKGDADWQDCSEFKDGKRTKGDFLNTEELSLLLDGCSDVKSAFELNSHSLTEENLNHFDEKLKLCFQNLDPEPEVRDSLMPIQEDTILKSDEIWKCLAENYATISAVSWSHSRVRSLQQSTTSLKPSRQMKECSNVDVPDDEELREKMDLHSIIVSCVMEGPMLTAEQVIEEIEEIMDSSDEDAVHFQKRRRSCSVHIHRERARRMTLTQLSSAQENIETAIRKHSEELVRQLDVRDELEFEKEVKNSFISILIDVQNRLKRHRESLKKRRQVKSLAVADDPPSSRFSVLGISSAIQKGFRQAFGNVAGEKEYITTVIPYERKDQPPSLQDLQVFTKILEAMRDDDDKVPSLLTDYILRVLCPT